MNDREALKSSRITQLLSGTPWVLASGKDILSCVASLLVAPVLNGYDNPSPVSPPVAYRAGPTPIPPTSCAFKMGRERPSEIYLLKVLPLMRGRERR